MNVNKYKDEMYVAEIREVEAFKNLDEFDLRDLCNLISEPARNIDNCISKGQLKALCKQLLAENLALRKHIGK